MAVEHPPIELLSAYLDREATPDEVARVEAHLDACPDCRSELEDLRRIAASVATLEVPPVPEGLRSRIAASIAPPRRRSRAWIGAAASLAAVGLVATAWYLQGPPRTPEVPAAPTPQAAAPPPPVPPATDSDSVEPKLKALGYLGSSEGSVVGGVEGATPAPVPPPPPSPPPPPLREDAERSRESTLKKEVAAAPVQPSQDDARDRERAIEQDLPREEQTEGRLQKSQPSAEPKASNVMAPFELSRRADPPCGVVPFLDISVDSTVDRTALEAALRRAGADLHPGTDGTLGVTVPRTRWTGCRTVLSDAGIVVDEAKLASAPPACVGVRLVFPAPR